MLGYQADSSPLARGEVVLLICPAFPFGVKGDPAGLDGQAASTRTANRSRSEVVHSSALGFTG